MTVLASLLLHAGAVPRDPGVIAALFLLGVLILGTAVLVSRLQE